MFDDFIYQSQSDNLNEGWKDLSTLIMEERFKAEERKEILGEEWRKVSRIFDRLVLLSCFSSNTLFLKRFLLFVFSTSSFVATICCIMMSPHFPDHGTDEGGEDDVFDQPDDFEELLLP